MSVIWFLTTETCLSHGMAKCAKKINSTKGRESEFSNIEATSELIKCSMKNLFIKFLNVFRLKECLNPMQNRQSKISLLVQPNPLGFIAATTSIIEAVSELMYYVQ